MLKPLNKKIVEEQDIHKDLKNHSTDYLFITQRKRIPLQWKDLSGHHHNQVIKCSKTNNGTNSYYVPPSLLHVKYKSSAM